MLKKNLALIYKEYNRDNIGSSEWDKWVEQWILPRGESDSIDTGPNIKCDCGSEDFKVCWWDYPFTGGYCKISCTKCNKELVLIDDFA